MEDLRPATLLIKILWHRCFPVNFAKFLREPFLIEHLWVTASVTLNTHYRTFTLYPFHVTGLFLCFQHQKTYFQGTWKDISGMKWFKGTVVAMRYFASSEFSRSLVHEKNFHLTWQVVFKLGYEFCQER